MRVLVLMNGFPRKFRDSFCRKVAQVDICYFYRINIFSEDKILKSLEAEEEMKRYLDKAFSALERYRKVLQPERP
jgi:hypothetical protein